jgi:hypothetical protein
MSRSIAHLLVAALLLFSQQAAQHHALSHALHDVAVAERGADGAPPLDHTSQQCIAYLAVGSALSSTAPVLLAADLPAGIEAFSPQFVALLARVAFHSRAPPFSA